MDTEKTSNLHLATIIIKIVATLVAVVIAMFVTGWVIGANDWSDGQYSEYAVNSYRYPTGAGPELLLKHQVERNYILGFVHAMYAVGTVYLVWRITRHLDKTTRRFTVGLTILVLLIVIIVLFGPVVYEHEPLR